MLPTHVRVTKDLRVIFHILESSYLPEHVEGSVRYVLNGETKVLHFTYYFSGDKTLLRMVVDTDKRIELQCLVVDAIRKSFIDNGLEPICTSFTDVAFRSVLN